MPITRRELLATSAATLATLAAPRGRAEAAPALVARPGRIQLAPAGHPETSIWGYGGGVPGPTIRVPQGGRVARRLVNELPQGSSVHWHGIRIANAMDGVPGLTQDMVEPGAEFLYDFVAPDAGTYWYHPHNRTFEQAARGLYGALIVEEPAPPEVDHDEALLIDDWRLADDASIAEDFENLRDRSHQGRIGNWITVNADGAWTRPATANQRWRLRLANVANARIFEVSLQGLDGWVVAVDGQPFATPNPAGRIELAPAQRADLIVDVVAAPGEEAFLISHERDGGYALATFPVEGSARPARLAPPAPLAPNPVAPLGDLDTAQTARLVMEGGAMGGMRGAILRGRHTDMRVMAAEGMVWAMNGIAGMPEAPLLAAGLGQTVRIEMVNETAWPHGMHLHGHHFRRTDGPDAPGPLRDTILIQPRARAEIAFVADNPGDWLVHCHMLEHADSGMMTWLSVG